MIQQKSFRPGRTIHLVRDLAASTPTITWDASTSAKGWHLQGPAGSVLTNRPTLVMLLAGLPRAVAGTTMAITRTTPPPTQTKYSTGGAMLPMADYRTN